MSFDELLQNQLFVNHQIAIENYVKFREFKVTDQEGFLNSVSFSMKVTSETSETFETSSTGRTS